MSKAPERVEVHRTEDAMKEAVTILGPQLGTDGAMLSEFKIDPRRMSRLNLLEITATAYFLPDHDDDWIGGFLGNYLNLKMSEEGHERSVLLVEALKAIGGVPKQKNEKRDDRGWVQRNVTARNKGPDASE